MDSGRFRDTRSLRDRFGSCVDGIIFGVGADELFNSDLSFGAFLMFIAVVDFIRDSRAPREQSGVELIRDNSRKTIRLLTQLAHGDVRVVRDALVSVEPDDVDAVIDYIHAHRPDRRTTSPPT